MIASFFHKISSVSSYVSDLVASEQEDPIDTESKKRCQELVPEIQEIKKNIQQLDDFIKSKPDLEKKCWEYIQKQSDTIIVHKMPTMNNFDPNNPVDQMTRLELEKNYFENRLNQRIRFMRRNSEIYLLFTKYVKEEQEVNLKKLLFLENIK